MLSTDTILASISRSHLLFHMTAVLPKLWLLLAGELLANFDHIFAISPWVLAAPPPSSGQQTAAVEKDVHIVKEAPSKPKSGRLRETGPSVTLQGGLRRTVHQLLLVPIIV